jgi:hypothetical protein
MKSKKIFVGLIAVGIAVTAAVNVSLNSEGDTFSDLTIANIEALADAEEGSGNKICYYKGTSTYSDYYECTSNYPNVGSCENTSRSYKYFSSDKHVCSQ